MSGWRIVAVLAGGYAVVAMAFKLWRLRHGPSATHSGAAQVQSLAILFFGCGIIVVGSFAPDATTTPVAFWIAFALVGIGVLLMFVAERLERNSTR